MLEKSFVLFLILSPLFIFPSLILAAKIVKKRCTNNTSFYPIMSSISFFLLFLYLSIVYFIGEKELGILSLKKDFFNM